MKRIVLWGLSTLSAVVMLFGYHTSTSATMATTNEAAISSSGAGQPAAGTSGTSGTSSGGAPPGDSNSGDSNGGGANSGNSNGGAAGSSTGASTVTGTPAQTQYGPVQVQLEVSGSQLTNVSVVQYPDADPRSAQISQAALPQLIQETLDAQGSGIDMVSGATFTSNGYLTSLQSALDQAGL